MTNTASTNQKTTKSPEKQCQDLAFPNELDRMEYEPGAYLAEGAELLNHVACTLQGASLPSGSEAYQVSMSYPTSGGDGPVRTTKIPISGLALQLHPTELHIGIPVSVHRALRRIVSEAAIGRIRDCRWDVYWSPTMPPQDGHHWMFATAEKQLKAAVYVDDKRNFVQINDLLQQVDKNLECDAFVSLYFTKKSSTDSTWALEMTVTDVLITNTTLVRSCSFRGSELVGRYKFSSFEVVSAFNKLQIAKGEAKAGTSA